MDFTKAVAEAMERMGLKRSDVAKSAGYSHQYISDLLAGDRRWNEDSINRVCGALGITIEIKQSEVPDALEDEQKNCLEV